MVLRLSYWQHMLYCVLVLFGRTRVSLLRSCLCKVTSCVSKALFLAARALSLCKNYPQEHFFAFLRLSLLSSLLFHLRTLKIFSYQWLPVWTPRLPKDCIFRGKYVPTVTYGHPNVNTSRTVYTHFRQRHIERDI